MSSAALLSLCIGAGAAISAASSATIQSTVASNWRGSYDLLVTGGSGLTGQASHTDGLIEQNFVPLADGNSVSGSELAELRAIDGIEVAAPVTFLGQLQSPSHGLVFSGSEPDGPESRFFEKPRAFAVGLSTSRNDGVETQEITARDFTVVTGRIDNRPIVTVLSDDGKNYAPTALTDGTGQWQVSAAAPVVPELRSGLVAVDPSAEIALLGDSGGFLKQLSRFDALQSSAASPAQIADEISSDAFGSEEALVRDGYSEGPVVPVVTSAAAYSPIIAQVSMSSLELDNTEMADYLDENYQLSEAGRSLIEAATRGDPQSHAIDITGDMTPFTVPDLNLTLPGASESAEAAVRVSTPDLLPTVIGRGDWTPPAPSRLVNAPNETQIDLEASPHGEMEIEFDGSSFFEQTYRVSSPIGEPLDGMPLFAPVGTYIPGEIVGSESSAAYVPLGIYQDDKVAVAEPGSNDGKELAPSFSGQGAVLASPGAITSLTGASALTGRDDIDVVRVRVSGIEGYSTEAMSRIERVAAQISDLGLDVRVVAGSSLAKVGVYLPEFLSDGSDLGWTTQEWTSLGAAVQVERAQLGATVALLVITLVGLVALGVVVQTIGVGARRSEAYFLELQGWTRQRIRRWFFAEDAPALIMVILAGASSLALADFLPVRWVSVAASVAFVLVTVACVSATTRTHSTKTRSALGPRRPVERAATIGARYVFARPVVGIWSGLSVVILTATVLAFLAVVDAANIAAGSSRVAELVSSRTLLPQTVLALGSLVGGGLLFTLSVREQITSSRHWHAMLITSGWDPSTLGETARAQLLTAILPSAVLAWAAGSAFALTLLSPPTTGQSLVLAAAVPLAAVIGATVWARIYSRRLQ